MNMSINFSFYSGDGVGGSERVGEEGNTHL